MVTTHVFLPLMWSSTDHSTDNNYKRVGNFNPEPYIHQIKQVVYHSADSFGRSRLFDLVCYLLQPRDYLNLRTHLGLYINFFAFRSYICAYCITHSSTGGKDLPKPGIGGEWKQY